MCSDSWPNNVRVRDFVYKRRRNDVVAIQQFLQKSLSS